ncbi:MAG: ubiquinone/menaquinone biosynthesis methyltransferase [Chloroflexota bacterium]|nr:ubiquinone/menaquinone biosynthesis methyltransferase [Chloroflexota bacterium]
MANLSGDAKQTYVADLFARIAGRYDLMNTLMTGGMHHWWKRVAARLAADGLTGPALDIATGTGDLAYALSRTRGITHSVGVDLLPEMIVLANGKRAGKADSGRVAFLVGDALALPFPDGAFACVTAGFSLRNMPDLPQAISEMARVVRPGGRVATLELTPMAPGPWARLFRPYFHGIVPLIGQLVAGDRTAYTYLPQSVDYFLQADRLAGLFSQVGLENVGYRKLGFGTVAIHYGTKPPF